MIPPVDPVEEFFNQYKAHQLQGLEPTFRENPRLVDGDGFLLDEPSQIEIRWGNEDDLLWAAGESLMIFGPAGVGKTTLTGQLVEALVSISSEVLARKVYPAKRVLYLAMDRPRQVRRAFLRLFTPEQREILKDRLIFHKGPLEKAPAADPTYLMKLAQSVGADVIIVDSLKDMARDISDPKTGADINTAFQHCLAEGIDVLILHHPRKASDNKRKKPTSIDESMGSYLIVAGVGSIVLLWGEPGADTVEFNHLKPIQDKVGPFVIEHDHSTGRSTVVEEFNLLQYIRGRRTIGATIIEASKAQYGGMVEAGQANYKRTARSLVKLEKAGWVSTEPPDSDDSTGRFRERRYFALDPVDSLSHRGH